jgi:hypothetical protein
VTEIAGLSQLLARILERLEDGSYREGFSESFQRGSAEGRAAVRVNPDDPGEFEFQVQMAVMRAPDGGEAGLLRRLLELNQGLRGRAAFSLDPQGVVSLMAARPVRDLDPSEVVEMILWTSQQADRLDDVLLNEFGYRGGR